MKRLRYFLALLMLTVLVNCTATTNTTKEEKPSSINSVIEGLKSIPLPKF